MVGKVYPRGALDRAHKGECARASAPTVGVAERLGRGHIIQQGTPLLGVVEVDLRSITEHHQGDGGFLASAGGPRWRRWRRQWW